jgi:hypothetical protein
MPDVLEPSDSEEKLKINGDFHRRGFGPAAEPVQHSGRDEPHSFFAGYVIWLAVSAVLWGLAIWRLFLR